MTGIVDFDIELTDAIYLFPYLSRTISMNPKVVFYNNSIVLFISCFQYLVLGLHNIVRTSYSTTAVEYYMLRPQLIFIALQYFVTVILLCSTPKASESESALDTRRMHIFAAMCDVTIASIIVLGVTISFQVETLLSCYTELDRDLCRNTWIGNYRIGFAFFYLFTNMIMMASLQMIRIKLRKDARQKEQEKGSYFFLFACIFLVFFDTFKSKMIETCTLVTYSSSLPIVSSVIILISLTFAVDLVEANDIFQMIKSSTRLRNLFHVAFYVSVYLTYNGIFRHPITLSILGIGVILNGNQLIRAHKSKRYTGDDNTTESSAPTASGIHSAKNSNISSLLEGSKKAI